MADDSSQRKRRGRYKEYMRHSNPFKFQAARLAAKRINYKVKPRRTSSHNDGNVDGDSEFYHVCDNHDNSEFCSYEPEAEETNDIEPKAINDATSSLSEDEAMAETEEAGDFETATNIDDDATLALSEDESAELLDFTDRRHDFERFVKDVDDSCSDSFSDYVNSDSDNESISERVETDLADDPLYSGAPITSNSSSALLLSFVMKHKLTREAFNDLLAVVEAHCPRPNNCKTTAKKLFEFVSQAKGNISKHYFCSYCKAYYGKGKDCDQVNGNCRICGKMVPNNKDEFFIEVPVSSQLQKFFGEPDFVHGLKHRFERVKRADKNIEDVYDGLLYQRKNGQGGFLSEPYNISLKLNTDGVAIFRSSQFGVWPLFFLINELPPSLRCKSKYRVFGGLWYGEEKPFFSTFLKPFIDTLREAEIHGIAVVLPDGVKANTKVMVLSSHFDLPARAGVLEQVTYIGHDSCCYCDEHGEIVKTSCRGHVMSFPFRNTASGHAKLRTAEEVKAHSFNALERTTTVCGFKAPSALLQLPSFDIVNGVGIDAMHCVYLGVVKQLIGLWFSSKHSGQNWYCGNSGEKVDRRLLEIKPPTVITRVPRSIQHHVKFWKATEYRNWLLYYSLPCMKGVLDEEYHQHYALLVGAIVLLSGRSISPEQLEIARKLLVHFVEMHDVYYGPRYVLMNQHLLLHLTESVINHGPLWCSSLFVFEDWNGDISNYFHGTQNIASQIMTAVTSNQRLPQLIDEMPSGDTKDLVFRLCGHIHRTNRTHLKSTFYAIGALKKGGFINTPFEDDLLLFLGVECISAVSSFSRLQIGDAVFHSRNYKRVSRRNSFTVAYHQGQRVCYGQIEMYFVVSCESSMTCGAVIAPMSKSDQHISESHAVLGRPVNHIVSLHQPNNERFDVILVENIIDVCVYLRFQDCEMAYAAHFPNHLERD